MFPQVREKLRKTAWTRKNKDDETVEGERVNKISSRDNIDIADTPN